MHAGADLDMRNDEGNTPLHSAASQAVCVFHAKVIDDFKVKVPLRSDPKGRRGRIGTIVLGGGSCLILVSLVLFENWWDNGGTAERVHGGPPQYYLWAWRRPEDLSFIDPARVRLAVWTATIFIDEGAMTVERRSVPVAYPVGTEVVAVTRLEIAGVHDEKMAKATAMQIEAVGAAFGPVEYQVDFDARYSQRPFYAMLVRELRKRIGDKALSITALASWCMLDNWIAALPIDAAVPMVYRLGPNRESILGKLRSERRFAEPMCAGNVGYSADEEAVWLKGLERVFLFHPSPWTEDRFRTLVDRLEASR